MLSVYYLTLRHPETNPLVRLTKDPAVRRTKDTKIIEAVLFCQRLYVVAGLSETEAAYGKLSVNCRCLTMQRKMPAKSAKCIYFLSDIW